MKAILFVLLATASHALAAGALNTTSANEKQTIEVVVTDNGFEPRTIHVGAGHPVQLKVTRKTDATCATEIQVPEKKIKESLPQNKTITIDLGSLQKGEVKFGCGMNMMEKGKLVVQ